MEYFCFKRLYWITGINDMSNCNYQVTGQDVTHNHTQTQPYIANKVVHDLEKKGKRRVISTFTEYQGISLYG